MDKQNSSEKTAEPTLATQRPTDPEILDPKLLSPQKKSSPIKIIISGIFLLITGLALAGFIYREEITKLTAKPTPTPAPQSPTPTPDPTADWETLNTDLFTVKYPSAWSLNREDPITPYPSTNRIRNFDINKYNEAISQQKKNTPDGFSDLFSVDFVTNKDLIEALPTELSLLEFVREKENVFGNRTFEEKSIDGNTAVTAISDLTSINLANYSINTYILYKNNVYLISGYIEHPIYTNNGVSNFIDTYNQILSTFKFTDNDENPETETVPATNSAE